MPKPTVDLSGQTFGRLTVIHKGEDYTRKNGRHETAFVCQCECGNVIRVRASQLKSGNTQSCGCARKEQVGALNRTHGKSGTRLHYIWARMRQRCLNESCSDYKHYGARGITVCEEWSSFEAFETWALSSGYDDTLSIDRQNNSLGYSPENCRWVTDVVQANNKRSNRLLTYNGKTQTVSQWAKEIGINRQTIEQRLLRDWSIEDALTTPLRKRRKK